MSTLGAIREEQKFGYHMQQYTPTFDSQLKQYVRDKQTTLVFNISRQL